MYTSNESSISLIMQELPSNLRVLLSDILHFDQRGILEWWMKMQPPSKRTQCNVIIEMVLSDLAVVRYENTEGTLEFGGYKMLKKIGIE